ncbi:hypothetical protein RFI_33047 [Reticulomyxa filosa]|nr:hypothetical protein RFI_33047 [Reticulomyxa filosa]|eukprot:ETO04352.1 hypothetical protein RFI_33047 [Reticulomyxa filosa]
MIHLLGGLNKEGEEQRFHLSVKMEEFLEKSELLQMIKEQSEEIRALKFELVKMKLEQPFALPKELEDMEHDQKAKITSKEWKHMMNEMQDMQIKLKELQKDKIMNCNDVKWDDIDIWSCDGLFQKVVNDHLLKMEKIFSIIARLLILESTINVILYTYIFRFALEIKP